MNQLPSRPPVLEITDGNGQLLWDAPFRLLATMLHPEDPEKRRQYFEVLLASAVLEARSEDVPRELIVQASNRMRLADAILKRAHASAYGAAVTGDLLLTVITAALYSPRDASLERAIRAWGEDQVRGKTGTGGRVAASPSAIKAAWSRFKSVAHLCAAFRLSTDLGEASPIVPVDKDRLPNFLATSEALRILGEEHHPPSGRTGSKPAYDSTLDPQLTWQVPSDLVLPTITLSIPPPTEFVRRVFKEYRAD